MCCLIHDFFFICVKKGLHLRIYTDFRFYFFNLAVIFVGTRGYGYENFSFQIRHQVKKVDKLAFAEKDVYLHIQLSSYVQNIYYYTK